MRIRQNMIMLEATKHDARGNVDVCRESTDRVSGETASALEHSVRWRRNERVASETICLYFGERALVRNAISLVYRSGGSSQR